MTLGRAIMAISTVLAVAACADCARDEFSPAGQDKPGQDIVTTIPSDHIGAALLPRESQAPRIPSDSVAAPAESPASSHAVESAEQDRDELAVEAHASKPEPAEPKVGAAKPSEPQESAPEPRGPAEPPKPSEPPKLSEPVEAKVADTDNAEPERSLVATQAGPAAKDQSGDAGANLSEAMQAGDPAVAAKQHRAEKPSSDAAGSPTIGGHDDVAEKSSASADMPVSGAPAAEVKAPVEPREKTGVEAASEPVIRQPGTSIAAGDPGVDDFNQVAALPPDSPDSDAVAEVEEAGQPETRPENQPLSCDIVRLLGQSIGQWRLRGESAGAARRKAADEVARQIENVSDGRLGFKAWMYANRIYDLKPDHSPEGFASYAHAACLILRGQKGLIPVDEDSRDMLDRALRGCESGARGDSGLDACISERMEKIVQERGRQTD